MLNKVEVYTCKTTLDNGREYMYVYYLTETYKEIAVEHYTVSVPSYGIGIMREEILDGKVIETYDDKFDSVSPFRDKVMGLIDYLIENEVSPIHLIDIIGENVDNWVDDYEVEARNKLKSNVMA